MSANKRFILNIIIVLLVIGVLAAALYALTRPEDEPPAPEEYSSGIEVFSVEPEAMTYARVSNKNGSYYLYKYNGSWRLEGFDGVTLDSNMLDALTNTFSDVTSPQLVDEAGENAAAFGLDKPETTITVGADSGERSFYIGSETPDGSGYYFSTDSGPEVYVMESYVADVAFLTARDYVSLGTAFTAEEITEMRVEPRGGSPLHVVMNPDGAADQYGLLSYWTITEPEERSASNSDVTTVLLTPASEMESTASGIYEDNAENRAMLGLDSPEFSLEVTLEGGEASYLISPAAGEYRYIIREGTGYILRVDDAGCAFLYSTMEQVAEKYLAMIDVADLSGIEMAANGETKTFTVLDGAGDNASFYVDGRELAEDEFRGFYQQIVALLVSGVLEDAPMGDTIGSITYILNSGEKLKLDFTPYDERNCGVYINGKRQYSMLRKNVEKIFDLMNDI